MQQKSVGTVAHVSKVKVTVSPTRGRAGSIQSRMEMPLSSRLHDDGARRGAVVVVVTIEVAGRGASVEVTVRDVVTGTGVVVEGAGRTVAEVVEGVTVVVTGARVVLLASGTGWAAPPVAASSGSTSTSPP